MPHPNILVANHYCSSLSSVDIRKNTSVKLIFDEKACPKAYNCSLQSITVRTSQQDLQTSTQHIQCIEHREMNACTLICSLVWAHLNFPTHISFCTHFLRNDATHSGGWVGDTT